MARSVNKATLVGFVGKDPDIRSANGRKYANFSLATSESWKDKGTDDWKEITTWHRVSVANDRLVDVVEKYVRKGAKLYIEGKIDHRNYTQDGEEKTVVEIKIGPYGGELVLLDTKDREDQPAAQSRSKPAARSTPAPRHTDPDPFEYDDDPIPF